MPKGQGGHEAYTGSIRSVEVKGRYQIAAVHLVTCTCTITLGAFSPPRLRWAPSVTAASSQYLPLYRRTRRPPQVTQCPGLEVMAVHDEQPTLSVQDRPLHLTQFSADWVGRPGTPLTETAKLQRVKRATQRDQGWYSADSDLPPVFLERAQRMTEARVVREQVCGGTYVASLSLQRGITQGAGSRCVWWGGRGLGGRCCQAWFSRVCSVMNVGGWQG